MRITILLALGLAVSACGPLGWPVSGGPALSAADGLRIACDSYDGTLDALAVQRELGHLSAEQIASVDRAIALLSPTCTGTPGATVSLAVLEAQLIELIKLKEAKQ